MMTLKSNDINLAYESFGDEASETILLISGLGTQMLRWTATFCETLVERGYRVIRFDNRDAGRSTHFADHPALDFAALAAKLANGQRPEIPYTLDDMASDAVGLLDALSIQKAHLVGRSMGGMIAQVAAVRHPNRILSLTSIMSSSGNPNLPPAKADVMALMTMRTPSPFEDEAGFVEHSLAFARRIAGTGATFDEEAHRTLVLEEVRRAYNPGGFGRQITAIAMAGDRRPELAKIKVPTLVIHGTDDPLFLPDCGRDTASSIPGAEFMLIDGMGHDLPPVFYQVVADGIDRTARRAKRVPAA
jgi:pimeloyl-ACP methyl ester carboxylesterase